jgi:anti-sigma factor RsiW
MKNNGNNDMDYASDADLLAYADGTLPAEDMARVEARLAADASAREAVMSWRHHANLLHAAGKQADSMPINLQTAALERKLAKVLKARSRRAFWLGPNVRQFAASIFIFGAGWLAHEQFTTSIGTGVDYPLHAELGRASHFVTSYPTLASASSVPTELDATLDWISTQMQRKIDSDHLARLGYNIETAQLVESDKGPVALFQYRGPDNKRITVSMMPHSPQERIHALRILEVEDGRLAYWTADGMDYSVIGAVDAALMTTLAAAVK